MEDKNKFTPNDNTGSSTDTAPVALDDERRLKVLSPGMLVFKRFIRNKLAIVGTVIIVFMFLFSFVGGIIIPYSEAQVFKGTQSMVKDYAAMTQNDEFRYVYAGESELSVGARNKMMFAITQGETGFESDGVQYGLKKESDTLYRATTLRQVAAGKGLKGNYAMVAEEGVTLPDDFMEKFNAANAADEETFVTDDGTEYTISKNKMSATVYGSSDVALVSKYIFDGDLAGDYTFRLDAERAMIAGAASFESAGSTYQLEMDGDAATIKDSAGEIIAAASHFILNPIQVGTVFPEGFAAAVQQAVDDGNTTFTLLNAEGNEQSFEIVQKNGQYAVRTAMDTQVILMYNYPSWEHWLGTDANGMDVLTRLMYGGRISLMIGFIVVILETILGVILGGVAGYFGKWVDNLIMRLVDIFNCIPGYPIYIIMGAIMDAQKVDPRLRLYFLMIVLGVLGWPGIARIVRGQILSLREQEFMTATEATGLSVNRRIFRHLVPNVIPQLIVIDTMNLGGIILTEATLSFLGLGVKYPLASWGSIINAVSDVYVMTNYWFAWIPAGMLILLTVLGFNFIGDGLRDAFDPKMKR